MGDNERIPNGFSTIYVICAPLRHKLQTPLLKNVTLWGQNFQLVDMEYRIFSTCNLIRINVGLL